MPISRRHFLASSLALPAFAAKKVVEERPNILLLIADDLPSWMMGTYGNKEVKTPNLNRLGQMGTHFRNHFTPAPAAAPGFASLMTGRSPMQLGEAGTISAADVTLEKVLAAAGYACHSASPEEAAALIDQPKDSAPFFLTVRYSALVLPYGTIPSKYLDLYSNQNFDSYSEEPAAANARLGKEMLANRVANLRKVAAAISTMDDNVGALTGRIFRKQLLDRTLVVFTSTCGALLGRHGLWDAGDASEPVNMYDESVRVPLLWSWPGRVPAQEERMELVNTYDLLPTFCDLISATLPAATCAAAATCHWPPENDCPKSARGATLCSASIATPRWRAPNDITWFCATRARAPMSYLTCRSIPASAPTRSTTSNTSASRTPSVANWPSGNSNTPARSETAQANIFTRPRH